MKKYKNKNAFHGAVGLCRNRFALQEDYRPTEHQQCIGFLLKRTASQKKKTIKEKEKRPINASIQASANVTKLRTFFNWPNIAGNRVEDKKKTMKKKKEKKKKRIKEKAMNIKTNKIEIKHMLKRCRFIFLSLFLIFRFLFSFFINVFCFAFQIFVNTHQLCASVCVLVSSSYIRTLFITYFFFFFILLSCFWYLFVGPWLLSLSVF